MDRLKLTLAGCGLAALLAAPGCRNLHSEVPAGRPYSSDGRQMPSVGFSSDPHPMVGGAAMPPLGGMGVTGGDQTGATGRLGTPAPGSTGNYAAPTGNAYGPPGTSNLGSGPSMAPPPALDPVGSAPASSAAPSLPSSVSPGLPGPATAPR